MSPEKKKADDVQTLEKGNVYFFYRPRVEEESPQSEQDIQRLYMVLSPEQEQRYRLAIVGQKELPDPARHGKSRYWGFVDMVRNNSKSIVEELGGEKYATKTRGERHLPAARPAGEGVYRILRHGDHTHLVYELELPKSPADVQHELNIEDQASYIISVKNPERGSPQAAGLSDERQANFPKKLMDVFRGRKFADADPAEFLDHEGAEFVLVAASEDISEELGIELDTDSETNASADIFKDLHVDRQAQPIKPLFSGEWE